MKFIQKKRMSAKEILDAYEKGERDFSDIDASNSDFTNKVLKGAAFRNSNISYTYFTGVNLEECDFSGANVEWSDFSGAKMKNAKFAGANMSFSVFNDAVFANADLAKADMSWSLLFRTDMALAKVAGTNFYGCAFSMADVTPEGLQKVRQMLSSLGKSLPFEQLAELQFIVNKTQDKFNAFTLASREEPKNVNYSVSVGSRNYSVQSEGAESHAYTMKTPYKPKSIYVR